jgi:hypothetical protein
MREAMPLVQYTSTSIYYTKAKRRRVCEDPHTPNWERDMVYKKDEKGGGWHEPPYTKEEEMDMYRRMGAGPQTIYRRRQRPADKPALPEPPGQEGK